MLDVLVFGVNLLLLAVVWRYGWKKAAVDDCRDDLHHLREKVRNHFLEKKIPLDHPAYRQLRDTLNVYLRFTNRASLISLFCFSWELKKYPDYAQIYESNIKQKYKFSDAELGTYVLNIRRQAADAMMVYMVKTSVVAMAIGLILCPILAIFLMLKKVFSDVRTALNQIHSFASARGALVVNLRAAGRLMADIAVGVNENGKGRVNVIEECSYNYAHNEICVA